MTNQVRPMQARVILHKVEDMYLSILHQMEEKKWIQEKKKKEKKSLTEMKWF